MLIETTELTLAHVGLGDLTEEAALALFATAQAHRLTAGLTTSLRDVVDRGGQPLYPAYYTTHLRVPPTRRLEEHRLWERVAVGVDVRMFGGMVLDTTYLLVRPGEIGEDSAGWDLDSGPSLRSGSTFIVDRGDGRAGEPEVAIPKAGTLAELPKLARPPEALDRFRAARVRGTLADGLPPTLRPDVPIEYVVRPGLDAASGHDMMFARFVAVMDDAEHRLLAEHLDPPFPTGLLACRSVLERETYYFGNCGAGEVLRVRVAGRLTPCRPDLHGSATNLVSAAELSLDFAVYQRATGDLLALARARKLLLVPTARQGLLRDAERLLRRYGSNEEGT